MIFRPRYLLLALPVFWLLSSGCDFFFPISDARLHRIARAALNDDSDAAFERFLDILPRHREYYLFEGDLLYTRAELRSELDVRRTTYAELRARGLLSAPGETAALTDFYDTYLTVRRRTRHGPFDIWPRGDRSLSYSVDTQSFDSQSGIALVRSSMRNAAADWLAACTECGIDITEVTHTASDRPRPGTITFVVHQDNGPYLATAFHRSWSDRRRYLKLDADFFANDVDHVGVLRHELGHILGYVHEHIRSNQTPIGICKREREHSKAITPYDPKSVMHLVCGASEAASFPISDSDIVGHRHVYSTTGPE